MQSVKSPSIPTSLECDPPSEQHSLKETGMVLLIEENTINERQSTSSLLARNVSHCV